MKIPALPSPPTSPSPLREGAEGPLLLPGPTSTPRGLTYRIMSRLLILPGVSPGPMAGLGRPHLPQLKSRDEPQPGMEQTCNEQLYSHSELRRGRDCGGLRGTAGDGLVPDTWLGT